jgi:hypothetical protein
MSIGLSWEYHHTCQQARTPPPPPRLPFPSALSARPSPPPYPPAPPLRLIRPGGRPGPSVGGRVERLAPHPRFPAEAWMDPPAGPAGPAGPARSEVGPAGSGAVGRDYGRGAWRLIPEWL